MKIFTFIVFILAFGPALLDCTAAGHNGLSPTRTSTASLVRTGYSPYLGKPMLGVPPTETTVHPISAENVDRPISIDYLPLATPLGKISFTDRPRLSEITCSARSLKVSVTDCNVSISTSIPLTTRYVVLNLDIDLKLNIDPELVQRWLDFRRWCQNLGRIVMTNVVRLVELVKDNVANVIATVNLDGRSVVQWCGHRRRLTTHPFWYPTCVVLLLIWFWPFEDSASNVNRHNSTATFGNGLIRQDGNRVSLQRRSSSALVRKSRANWLGSARSPVGRHSSSLLVPASLGETTALFVTPSVSAFYPVKVNTSQLVRSAFLSSVGLVFFQCEVINNIALCTVAFGRTGVSLWTLSLFGPKDVYSSFRRTITLPIRSLIDTGIPRFRRVIALGSLFNRILITPSGPSSFAGIVLLNIGSVLPPTVASLLQIERATVTEPRPGNPPRSFSLRPHLLSIIPNLEGVLVVYGSFDKGTFGFVFAFFPRQLCHISNTPANPPAWTSCPWIWQFADGILADIPRVILGSIIESTAQPSPSEVSTDTEDDIACPRNIKASPTKSSLSIVWHIVMPSTEGLLVLICTAVRGMLAWAVLFFARQHYHLDYPHRPTDTWSWLWPCWTSHFANIVLLDITIEVPAELVNNPEISKEFDATTIPLPPSRPSSPLLAAEHDNATADDCIIPAVEPEAPLAEVVCPPEDFTYKADGELIQAVSTALPESNPSSSDPAFVIWYHRTMTVYHRMLRNRTILKQAISQDVVLEWRQALRPVLLGLRERVKSRRSVSVGNTTWIGQFAKLFLQVRIDRLRTRHFSSEEPPLEEPTRRQNTSGHRDRRWEKWQKKSKETTTEEPEPSNTEEDVAQAEEAEEKPKKKKCRANARGRNSAKRRAAAEGQAGPSKPTD
ncbi:hypothetical protein FRB90_007623 [Tulasnella sp. 427]|nr:hypothetical protein FRB90_007623 [Tulasnella sp. 427]